MFNIATSFHLCLDPDNKKAMRLYLLLYSLEKYLNGALIEMKRLERTRKGIHKRMQEMKSGKGNLNQKSNHMIYLSCDTHFYFICIDKIYKTLTKLAEELKDKDIKKLKNRLKTIIDINSVRNDLEHIDARSLGFKSIKDEKQGIRKYITDFGNFIDDDFSFDGKRYASNKKSLDEIKKIYKDLIKILHKNYAINNPHYLRQIEQEVVLRAIDRKIKKLQKDGLLWNKLAK